MSDLFSRFVKACNMGKRGQQVAIQAAQATDQFKAHEEALVRFAKGVGYEEFLQEMRGRRDAAREERRANAHNHIALVSAMRAEDSFDEVVRLLETLRAKNVVTGQPEAEATSRWEVGS
jgi:phosphoglycolate phosphatase-like HAD superfamily hydrolase